MALVSVWSFEKFDADTKTEVSVKFIDVYFNACIERIITMDN